MSLPAVASAASNKETTVEGAEGHDMERLGLHPSHLPIGVMLDQDANGDPLHTSRCIRCDRVDGFPCLLGAKADAETVCVDPSTAYPNIDLVTGCRVDRIETDAS